MRTALLTTLLAGTLSAQHAIVPSGSRQEHSSPAAHGSPYTSITAKYREDVMGDARHRKNREFKLTYSVPIGSIAGRPLESVASVRMVDSSKFKEEFEFDVVLANSWRPGVGFLHESPTGKDYFGISASRTVTHVNFAAEALYAVHTHPGWAKIRMKAEIPLWHHKDFTVSADVRRYQSISPYEKSAFGAGVNLKTHIDGKKIYHRLFR